MESPYIMTNGDRIALIGYLRIAFPYFRILHDEYNNFTGLCVVRGPYLYHNTGLTVDYDGFYYYGHNRLNSSSFDSIYAGLVDNIVRDPVLLPYHIIKSNEYYFQKLEEKLDALYAMMAGKK